MIKKILQKMKKINFIKIIIIELYIVIAQLIWHCKDYILSLIISIPPYYLRDKFFYYTFTVFLILALTSILIFLIVKMKKYSLRIKHQEKDLKDTDLKNKNQEYIRCVNIKEGNDINEKIYVIDSKHISLEKMKNKKDELESLYDIEINSMEYGNTTKYINVYATPRKFLTTTLFDIKAEDRFLDNFISALVVGSSGTGKTYFTYQLLAKLIYNKVQSYQDKGVSTYICDIKNEDYRQFRNLPNYYGMNAIDGIRKVYDILTERMNNDEDNTNQKTIICLIEEYAGLLNSLNKKEQEEIKTMVANILFMGRSKKVIPIISLQRADAVYFPQGAKEQFKVIAMMGNISKIQLDMLLNDDFQSQITKNNSRGFGYVFEDGKNRLTRIKVPELKQEEKNNIDEMISQTMID